MHPYISKKIFLVIITLAIIFAQMSSLFLVKIEKANTLFRPEIAQSLEENKDITTATLPVKAVPPLIFYLPFWLVVVSTIHIFITREKRRPRDPLRA